MAVVAPATNTVVVRSAMIVFMVECPIAVSCEISASSVVGAERSRWWERKRETGQAQVRKRTPRDRSTWASAQAQRSIGGKILFIPGADAEHPDGLQASHLAMNWL